MRGGTVAVRLALCAFAAGSVTVPAFAQDNQACMLCHSDPSLVVVDSLHHSRSVSVDSTLFANSVHGSLQCIDCHADIRALPHPEKLKRVDCGSCHGDEASAFQSGIHGQALAAGDPEAPRCSTCHGTHDILPVSDSLSLVAPLRQPQTCGTCHGREDFIRTHRLPGALPAAQYENSVHARALRAGNAQAPSCSNCHHAHDILPPSDPRSPISRTNIQNTCGECHGEIAKVYAGSIHGERVREGYTSAPTCNTCHGEHNIQSPTREQAATNPTHVSQEVCQPCHASAVLNQAFGLPATQVSTYFSSYHGLAVARGSKVAANCTSCHGIHNIYATYDPRSTVYPANLEKTCGRCHPGAQENFVRTPVHGQAQTPTPGAVSVITDFYIVLIVVIITMMVIHNLIIYISFVARKFGQYRREPTVRRFSYSMIAQHMILLLSFVVLVITGFALKFPAVFHILEAVGIQEGARGVIHRIAGSTLIAAGLYHLYWLFFRRRGKIELRAMKPDRRDLYDVVALMGYYLRFSSQKPQFDRYSYIEKAEYWALVWGTAVMSITGLILWFPSPAAGILGSWAVPVATVIHFYEAILATLSILVWHLFFTIFHPEEYPMSLVWLNGKATREEVKHHHPLWHEELERQRRAAEANDKPGEKKA
jgi:formate dehydrogenase gamma subunit